MDSYADTRFYRSQYKGAFGGEGAALSQLLAMASRAVDGLTFGRIRQGGWDCLTEFQRKMVRLAVCHQADYYAEHGGDGEHTISGYSAAGVSVRYGGKATAAGRARFSAAGYDLLAQTGLMTRAISGV